MSETRTVHDPFIGVDVEVSDKLVDRLRGKYAVGPHLPNGNPEFGWRQFQAPPIQHEAADKIEALEAEIERLRAELEAARAEERELCALLAEQHTGMWDNVPDSACFERLAVLSRPRPAHHLDHASRQRAPVEHSGPRAHGPHFSAETSDCTADHGTLSNHAAVTSAPPAIVRM